MIRKYAQKEREIKTSPDCIIGSGYNTCKDVGFKAVELIEALKPEIDAMMKEDARPLKPQVHSGLKDLRTFLETFLFHFSLGQNAEYVSMDKDLFFLL